MEASSILEHVDPGAEYSRQHRRMHSGEIIWCCLCGCYAEHKEQGLTAVCEGKLQGTWKVGGREASRRALLANLHPEACSPIPPAVTERQWLDGVRTAVVAPAAGEQPSVPVRLCPASAWILDRLRAPKRQADREATSRGEVAQQCSSSSEPFSKRRRIIGEGDAYNHRGRVD